MFLKISGVQLPGCTPPTCKTVKWHGAFDLDYTIAPKKVTLSIS